MVHYNAPNMHVLVHYSAPNFTKITYNDIILNMKTKKKKLKNQRLIIERKISPWKKLRKEKRPSNGWLKAVRGALGINTRQLAKRCGLHHSTILRIEKNEAQNKISIESLKKFASAMDCQLVYAIVPKTKYNNLEEIIDKQAMLHARKLIKKVSHTMQLENQGISFKEIQNQTKKLANTLKDEMGSRLWEKV